jgi:hypothetical protein
MTRMPVVTVPCMRGADVQYGAMMARALQHVHTPAVKVPGWLLPAVPGLTLDADRGSLLPADAASPPSEDLWAAADAITAATALRRLPVA